MCVLEQRSGSENAALEQMSPNDAICVVWATSEFFYIFYCLFCMLKLVLVSMNTLQDRETLGMAALEKMGYG